MFFVSLLQIRSSTFHAPSAEWTLWGHVVYVYVPTPRAYRNDKKKNCGVKKHRGDRRARNVENKKSRAKSTRPAALQRGLIDQTNCVIWRTRSAQAARRVSSIDCRIGPSDSVTFNATISNPIISIARGVIESRRASYQIIHIHIYRRVVDGCDGAHSRQFGRRLSRERWRDLMKFNARERIGGIDATGDDARTRDSLVAGRNVDDRIKRM